MTDIMQAAAVEDQAEHIAPAPRVSVQAFCETVETAAAVQAAGEDRRMSKAHLKIQMGGITAAAEAYSMWCWAHPPSLRLRGPPPRGIELAITPSLGPGLSVAASAISFSPFTKIHEEEQYDEEEDYD